MITGFNTDVEYDGRVYHVQTEDKGVDNPIIETLIYCGGEILAARQSSYSDILEKGADEESVAGRIEAQHNQLIRDVKAGRYAEKRHRPFGEGIISNKSFDEVVLEYLRNQAGGNRISLEVIGVDSCIAGTAAKFDIRVMNSDEGKGVDGASVKVRIISTVGKSRILTQGKTSDDGRVSLTCNLPALTRGTAALIIQATAGKESAEIKKAIQNPARQAAG